ncbi:FN3 domain-containing metallophosphoesterase family protein [Thalassotalea marina]|uniref:Phosphoesterase n=1 Tax=Thalassotalea marina TaxID=1673741 RepID=A0A919BGB5_9GAMM|nr:FN3 domain-containing metallophosphoesterase family protein [Thalassotalea marina]GHF90016.1 phosphoesterase [Thalassotalea marina]
MKVILLFFLVLSLPTMANTPLWQQASEYPDRVTLHPTADPSRGFSVNWRTSEQVELAVAQIVQASAAARFDLNATTVKAKSQYFNPSTNKLGADSYRYQFNQSLPAVRYHQVTFDQLKPDTAYLYRVRGSEGKWSQWFHAKTASGLTSATTKFLYFGDAQNGMRDFWPAMLRKGTKHMPDADFALYAGDLVDHGERDQEWAQWYSAGKAVYAETPVVPVVGNHEFAHKQYAANNKQWLLSDFWRAQFALPENKELPESLQETTYVLHYPNVDVFVLNTEARHDKKVFNQQAQWLTKLLSNSHAKWKVLAFHHPIFSNCGMPLGTKGQDEPQIREVLLPIIKKYQIDLVLQGHDHAYSRGSIAGKNNDTVNSVFVTATSSPKAYPVKSMLWQEYQSYQVSLQRVGENTPTYQTLIIDNQSLKFAAYALTGELYDAFKLTKSTAGNLMMVPGNLMPERRFTNTEPYVNHNTLY